MVVLLLKYVQKIAQKAPRNVSVMLDESDVRWQALDCLSGKSMFDMIKAHSINQKFTWSERMIEPLPCISEF